MLSEGDCVIYVGQGHTAFVELNQTLITKYLHRFKLRSDEISHVSVYTLSKRDVFWYLPISDVVEVKSLTLIEKAIYGID